MGRGKTATFVLPGAKDQREIGKANAGVKLRTKLMRFDGETKCPLSVATRFTDTFKRRYALRVVLWWCRRRSRSATFGTERQFETAAAP